MPDKIYGVDPSKELNPVDVREAIVDCFTQAHGQILSEGRGFLKELSDEEFEEIKKLNVRELVRTYFEKVGADYEKPTKESLVQVCDQLREFAKNFRNPDLIKKHYQEIMLLIDKLK